MKLFGCFTLRVFRGWGSSGAAPEPSKPACETSGGSATTQSATTHPAASAASPVQGREASGTPHFNLQQTTPSALSASTIHSFSPSVAAPMSPSAMSSPSMRTSRAVSSTASHSSAPGGRGSDVSAALHGALRALRRHGTNIGSRDPTGRVSLQRITGGCSPPPPPVTLQRTASEIRQHLQSQVPKRSILKGSSKNSPGRTGPPQMSRLARSSRGMLGSIGDSGPASPGVDGIAAAGACSGAAVCGTQPACVGRNQTEYGELQSQPSQDPFEPEGSSAPLARGTRGKANGPGRRMRMGSTGSVVAFAPDVDVLCFPSARTLGGGGGGSSGGGSSGAPLSPAVVAGASAASPRGVWLSLGSPTARGRGAGAAGVREGAGGSRSMEAADGERGLPRHTQACLAVACTSPRLPCQDCGGAAAAAAATAIAAGGELGAAAAAKGCSSDRPSPQCRLSVEAVGLGGQCRRRRPGRHRFARSNCSSGNGSGSGSGSSSSGSYSRGGSDGGSCDEAPRAVHVRTSLVSPFRPPPRSRSTPSSCSSDDRAPPRGCGAGPPPPPPYACDEELEELRTVSVVSVQPPWLPADGSAAVREGAPPPLEPRKITRSCELRGDSQGLSPAGDDGPSWSASSLRLAADARRASVDLPPALTRIRSYRGLELSGAEIDESVHGAEERRGLGQKGRGDGAEQEGSGPSLGRWQDAAAAATAKATAAAEAAAEAAGSWSCGAEKVAAGGGPSAAVVEVASAGASHPGGIDRLRIQTGRSVAEQRLVGVCQDGSDQNADDNPIAALSGGDGSKLPETNERAVAPEGASLDGSWRCKALSGAATSAAATAAGIISTPGSVPGTPCGHPTAPLKVLTQCTPATSALIQQHGQQQAQGLQCTSPPTSRWLRTGTPPGRSCATIVPEPARVTSGRTLERVPLPGAAGAAISPSTPTPCGSAGAACMLGDSAVHAAVPAAAKAIATSGSSVSGGGSSAVQSTPELPSSVASGVLPAGSAPTRVSMAGRPVSPAWCDRASYCSGQPGAAASFIDGLGGGGVDGAAPGTDTGARAEPRSSVSGGPQKRLLAQQQSQQQQPPSSRRSSRSVGDLLRALSGRTRDIPSPSRQALDDLPVAATATAQLAKAPHAVASLCMSPAAPGTPPSNRGGDVAAALRPALPSDSGLTCGSTVAAGAAELPPDLRSCISASAAIQQAEVPVVQQTEVREVPIAAALSAVAVTPPAAAGSGGSSCGGGGCDGEACTEDRVGGGRCSNGGCGVAQRPQRSFGFSFRRRVAETDDVRQVQVQGHQGEDKRQQHQQAMRSASGLRVGKATEVPDVPCGEPITLFRASCEAECENEGCGSATAAAAGVVRNVHDVDSSMVDVVEPCDTTDLSATATASAQTATTTAAALSVTQSRRGRSLAAQPPAGAIPVPTSPDEHAEYFRRFPSGRLAAAAAAAAAKERPPPLSVIVHPALPSALSCGDQVGPLVCVPQPRHHHSHSSLLTQRQTSLSRLNPSAPGHRSVPYDRYGQYDSHNGALGTAAPLGTELLDTVERASGGSSICSGSGLVSGLGLGSGSVLAVGTTSRSGGSSMPYSLSRQPVRTHSLGPSAVSRQASSTPRPPLLHVTPQQPMEQLPPPSAVAQPHSQRDTPQGQQQSQQQLRSPVGIVRDGNRPGAAVAVSAMGAAWRRGSGCGGGESGFADGYTHSCTGVSTGTAVITAGSGSRWELSTRESSFRISPAAPDTIAITPEAGASPCTPSGAVATGCRARQHSTANSFRKRASASDLVIVPPCGAEVGPPGIGAASSDHLLLSSENGMSTPGMCFSARGNTPGGGCNGARTGHGGHPSDPGMRISVRGREGGLKGSDSGRAWDWLVNTSGHGADARGSGPGMRSGAASDSRGLPNTPKGLQGSAGDSGCEPALAPERLLTGTGLVEGAGRAPGGARASGNGRVSGGLCEREDAGNVLPGSVVPWGPGQG